MDAVLRQFAERIQAAVADRTPLRICGGGSKDFYGQSLQGEPLDVTPWRGITSYEPSELVVTVRAGTSLAELEAELAERGQGLAFEPPAFAGAAATCGGMVAAGLSGPSPRPRLRWCLNSIRPAPWLSCTAGAGRRCR